MEDKNIVSKIKSSLTNLINWIERNGWSGYDPYDIQPPSLFFQKKLSPLKRPIIKIFTGISKFSPIFFRNIFGIKKKINSNAMGLFAEGYLNLFLALKKEKYLDKAEECFNWVEHNYSKGYSGYCWGYPFDWASKIFIPKNTPSAVVSAICGKSFWEYYQYTRDEKYLKICKSICNFFLKNLNIDKFSEDKICFSYTPLDHFHVHNANLFVAEFLIKIGKEIKNQEFIDCGLKALNYALSEQNENGSICYWGKDQEKRCYIDHYHSGFAIRSLYSIWKLTGDEKIHKAVSRYYNFYLNNFFKSKTIPKITPTSIYPIDIHACAEAILCNGLLQGNFPKGKEYLENSIKWVIENMQTKEGWFIYRIENIEGIKWGVKIPYIRWGQAWMLNALSYVLLNKLFTS